MSAELSPIDQFDQHVWNLTDFSEYLRILFQEGVPAMETIVNPDDPIEEIDRQYRLCIGLTVARVIGNRRRAGLSTNIELLEHSFQELGMKEWIGEFLTEPTIKQRMADSIIFGLEVAKVIPSRIPPWLREPENL